MMQNNYNIPHPVCDSNRSGYYNPTPATWDNADKILGPIEWAWKGWLANGFLTVLAAESGIGKSALMLRIGAVYLAGMDWPDGTKYSEQTGSIVWCEAEAAQALNVSRAKQWRLPLDRILTPLADPLDDIDLSSPKHRQAIYDIAARPEVRLIVIDSLRGAHRGDEDSSEIIGVVMHLAQLARDIRKPVLMSHHLRKRTFFDANEVTPDRLRGSSAIVQPTRLIWAMDCPDPNHKELKRLSVIKSNMCKFPPPLGLKIDELGITFCTPPAAPKIETTKSRAVELAISVLEGGEVPSSDVRAAFEDHGISWRTAQDVKEKLGIVSLKKDRQWFWSLPAKDAEA